ncbi:hypothetical protein [Streptomyces sp. NPDC050759]
MAPLTSVAVVGEKVPVGTPGNSPAGMFGQRPTKAVARMGAAGEE